MTLSTYETSSNTIDLYWYRQYPKREPEYLLEKVLDHGPMSISQMGFNQLHPSHPLNSLLTV